jgi:hypothetical protein
MSAAMAAHKVAASANVRTTNTTLTPREGTTPCRMMRRGFGGSGG